MSKNLYIILVVVVAVLVGTFVFFGRPYKVAAPVPAPAVRQTELPAVIQTELSKPKVAEQSSAASTAAIIYTGSSFSPTTLTVKIGAIVTFQNKNSVTFPSPPFWPASDIHPTHAFYDGTTLAEHCQNGTSKSFDACKSIKPGSSWSFKFDKVGSWKYHNHLSPDKEGVIVVQ